MKEGWVMRNFESRCHLYEKICLYCGSAAIFFLLLAMILFLAWHIPQVFGEFTGRTARRAVRRMTDGSGQKGGPVTGKKGNGTHSCRKRGGRKEGTAGLASQDDIRAIHAARRIPAAFMAETAVLPQEEMETAALPQAKKSV